MTASGSQNSQGKTSGSDGETGSILGAMGQTITYSVRYNVVTGTKIVSFRLGGKELTHDQVRRLLVLVSPKDIENMAVYAKKQLEADVMVAKLQQGKNLSADELSRFITSNSAILDKLGDNGAALRGLYRGGVPRSNNNRGLHM